MSYAEWIANYVKRHPRTYGLCGSACKEMRAVFPELVEVPGWCNGREHVWLVDPEGNIVDPTASQFGDPVMDGFGLEYRAWKPGDEVRVGRCMNCGEDIYAEVENLKDGGKSHRSVCSDDCASELEAEFNCR